MTPDELAATTRRHAQLWSAGDADGVAALYSDSCTYEVPAQGLVMHGKQALVEFANGMFSMISSLEVKLRSVVASGNHSAREYTVTGMHAESGRSISVPGVSILEFEDDKIIRNTDYYDLSSFLQQVSDEA